MGRYINIDDNGNIRGFDIARAGYSLVYVENWQSDYYVKPIVNKIDNVWQVVETATQEEIDKVNQDKAMLEIDRMNEKFKADGLAYQKEIKNKVTLSLIGRTDAIEVMREINNTVYVMLNKIAQGDWALAVVDYLDGDNNPIIQEVIDLFNEVGQKAVEYYQNEYPHESTTTVSKAINNNENITKFKMRSMRMTDDKKNRVVKITLFDKIKKLLKNIFS